MTNQEIANRLHQLVKAGDYFTAYDELFDKDVVAKEPQLEAMGLGEVKGIDSVKDKVAKLGEGVAELISREMSTPIVTDKHIAFTNIVKAKLKDGGDFNLSEICLYEIQEGKIVSEEFIY
ncbi:MAG: nuclear transport factor 2 family protein [Bacteroidota bacterium]